MKYSVAHWAVLWELMMLDSTCWFAAFICANAISRKACHSLRQSVTDAPTPSLTHSHSLNHSLNPIESLTHSYNSSFVHTPALTPLLAAAACLPAAPAAVVC